MAATKRWLWWIGGAIVAIVVLIVGGTFVYINFIKGDPAPKLVLSTPSTTAGSGSTTGGSTTPVELTGTYTVAAGSQGQYRVKETLFGQSAEATGTTDAVTGSMTIEGTRATDAEVTVDLTQVSSDESGRDRQFQGRIMNTAEFPNATFALTQPIDFGSDPGIGRAVTLTASGDLTLHGVTRSVTFDLDAQRLDATTIEVAGDIPIHFPDYDIPNPSGGPASVGDDGTLEFLVRFTPT